MITILIVVFLKLAHSRKFLNFSLQKFAKEFLKFKCIIEKICRCFIDDETTEESEEGESDYNDITYEPPNKIEKGKCLILASLFQYLVTRSCFLNRNITNEIEIDTFCFFRKTYFVHG